MRFDNRYCSVTLNELIQISVCSQLLIPKKKWKKRSFCLDFILWLLIGQNVLWPLVCSFGLRITMYSVLDWCRRKLGKHWSLQNIIKVAIARNQAALRNIVNAFKPTYFVLITVNVWTAKIMKEVKRGRLSSMEIMPTIWRIFSKQQMQPLRVLLDHLVMDLRQ